MLPPPPPLLSSPLFPLAPSDHDQVHAQSPYTRIHRPLLTLNDPFWLSVGRQMIWFRIVRKATCLADDDADVSLYSHVVELRLHYVILLADFIIAIIIIIIVITTHATLIKIYAK